jgi:pimeloyl-ACP methyl ester carboxylesterase
MAYFTFRKRARKAQIKLKSGAQIIETSSGLIEYTIVGEGPTVLISHGGGGGYDQGLLLTFPEEGFKFISLSRPGYLGTPIQTGQTFEAMADSYANLLDSLKIDKVAIMGTSGGGPSTLQFALRHPDRCWGVLMISAISQQIPSFPPVMQWVVENIMPYSGFITWIIMNTWVLDLLIDRKTKLQLQGNPEKKAAFKELMDSIFPLCMRIEGALNDVREIAKMPIYPLEKITSPALVVHGSSDTIAPFSQGKWTASRIPNAQLLTIKDGQHFSFVTHTEQVKPAVIDFLKTHAPSD